MSEFASGTWTVPPLATGWLIVDGLPMHHRSAEGAGPDAPAIVHVHGFGISGTYMQPTAALLADRYRTFVPDLPGHGRSMRMQGRMTLPRLARALVGYCDAVGVETATFVGNSLGCPVICEFADAFPERVDKVVLVSPAGGVNNQPMRRAMWQMTKDGPREPLSMVPITVRDYLRFGVVTSLSLFKAMTEYPTLERLLQVEAPLLAIAGERDPLVDAARISVFKGTGHHNVRAVRVPGTHALNSSAPELVAALIEAHLTDAPLRTESGPLSVVHELQVPD